jgi:hypothetical protein
MPKLLSLGFFGGSSSSKPRSLASSKTLARLSRRLRSRQIPIPMTTTVAYQQQQYLLDTGVVPRTNRPLACPAGAELPTPSSRESASILVADETGTGPGAEGCDTTGNRSC